MKTWWPIVLILMLAGIARAEPVFVTVQVAGVERRALVFPGRNAEHAPAPVLLAFHGFTSTAVKMAGTRLHDSWPEATVVYLQGLEIFSQNRNRHVPAWQVAPGRDDDRDVHFIDALLPELQKTWQVDERRVYATGFSNGAIFSYVLLAMRPQKFAAFAMVAGASQFVSEATVPRPVMLIQGKRDTIVKPEWTAATCDLLRRLNGCGDEETEWAPNYISYEPIANGCPVIWRLHDGAHWWPAEATNKITAFFREYALPE